MKELYFGAAAIGVVVSTLAIIVTTEPSLSPSTSTSSRSSRKPRSSRSSSSRHHHHKHSRQNPSCIYEEDEDGNNATHLKPPESSRRRRPSTSSQSDDISVCDSRSDISASTDLTAYSDDGHPTASRSTRSNRSRRASTVSVALSEADEEARRELEEKLRAMEEQLEYTRGKQMEMMADYEAKVAHVQADVEKWQRESEKKWKEEVEGRMRDIYNSRLVVANEEVSRLKKQCALLNREVHKERAKNQTLSDTASIRSRSSTFSLRSRRESLAPVSP